MRRLALLILLPGLLAAAPAFADTRAGGSVAVTGTVPEDLYAAAGSLSIDGAVQGDAALAAGVLALDGDVAGDALAAGGRVHIGGGIGDDLRAFGGQVTLAGFVTDHAVIAGGTVSLEPESAIGGWAWIAGGTVDVAGQVGGDLRITAGTVTISGHVGGNVDVRGRDIRVLPGTIIEGDLVWEGAEPAIAEDVEILGNVVEGRPPAPGPAPEAARGYVGAIAYAVAIFVAAAGLALLAPAWVGRATATFRRRPGRTLASGAALLVLAPLVVMLLFLTGIGWLLGVVLLLGWLFALMLAGVLGILVTAEILSPAPPAGGTGRGRRLAVLLVIAGIYVFLQGVPYVGTVASLLAVCVGLGAGRPVAPPGPGPAPGSPPGTPPGIASWRP